MHETQRSYVFLTHVTLVRQRRLTQIVYARDIKAKTRALRIRNASNAVHYKIQQRVGKN